MRCLRSVSLTLVLLATWITPAFAQSGSFGSSVVVGDGELIVAEPNTYFRPGTVYVYRKAGNSWREVAQLRAPEAARADGFGAALAVSGTTLFIAQRGGRIHTFRRSGNSWQASGVLDAEGIAGLDPNCNQYGYCGIQFGLSLAANNDWLLIGEPGSVPGAGGRGGRGGGGRGGQPEQAQPTGVVHTFQRAANGTWTRHGTIRPSESVPGDAFGASVALADGRALVGSPGWNASGEVPMAEAGRVFEFVLENGQWREVAVLDSRAEANAQFGATLALRGDVAVIGAPGSGGGHGAAYLYRRDPASSVWSEHSRLAAFDGVRGDRFGSAVAIHGQEVWVGAPAPRGIETGMVYTFTGREAEPLLEASNRVRLAEAETVTRDAFGDRIVAGSNVMTVSATGMHHQSGAVYVYERGANGAWQRNATLVSPPDALAPLVGEERRCTEGKVGPFDCNEVELLAFLPNSMLRAAENSRGVRTNDNWGWTDPETGREYALVGRNDGTSFVDITDPTKPVLVGDLPKTPDTPPSQLWRDMKVYKDHVFIVADGAGNHGMQVFDLRKLRNVQNKPALFQPDAHYPRVASVHNIAINEESGYAYLVGSGSGGETCGGGLHMVDIREPLQPKFVGCFRDQRGTHDVQCLNYRGPDQRYQGREICLKSNAQFFAISDVTDKTNPVALSRVSHPNPAYLHQGWVTEDHKYFYMDDESDVIRGNVPTTRTLIWDLSDLQDPVLAKEFMGSMPASAHNQYIRGNFSYQANYRYGLHVLDVTDPVNPREVGHFDTSPFQEGPGFSGAWSTYPFFKSGTVIVTSLQEGVFFLKKRERAVF